MTVEEEHTMRAIQKIAKKVDDFTLRDYFAGQVLAGIMVANVEEDFDNNPREAVAKICYSYADALIKQRN
jgi:hypothetical protein